MPGAIALFHAQVVPEACLRDDCPSQLESTFPKGLEGRRKGRSLFVEYGEDLDSARFQDIQSLYGVVHSAAGHNRDTSP